VSNYEIKYLQRPILPGTVGIVVPPWEGDITDVGVEVMIDINDRLRAIRQRSFTPVDHDDLSRLLSVTRQVATDSAPKYVETGELDMAALQAGDNSLTTTPVVRSPHASDVADFEVQSDSTSGDYAPAEQGRSRTAVVVRNRFSSFMTPIAVALAIFAPAPPMGRRYRAGSSASETLLWHAWWEDDEWHYVPELITREQVEDLQRLLNLPPISDVEFDFRNFDE
jgi:hypothetical protein